MSNVNKNTLKIFNPIQANIFIKNNCIVVGCGFGKGSKVYIEFLRDEHFNMVLTKWQRHDFRTEE